MFLGSLCSFVKTMNIILFAVLFWVSFSKWKEGSASGKTRRELKGIKVMAQKIFGPISLNSQPSTQVIEGGDSDRHP